MLRIVGEPRELNFDLAIRIAADDVVFIRVGAIVRVVVV